MECLSLPYLLSLLLALEAERHGQVTRVCGCVWVWVCGCGCVCVGGGEAERHLPGRFPVPI